MDNNLNNIYLRFHYVVIIVMIGIKWTLCLHLLKQSVQKTFMGALCASTYHTVVMLAVINFTLITVTVSWRTKSPRTWLFVQQLVCTNNKKSKLPTTGPMWGWPVTGGFPSQRPSGAESFYVSWRHRGDWERLQPMKTHVLYRIWKKIWSLLIFCESNVASLVISLKLRR